MITTVCLNPAIDQRSSVDSLRIGEVNRLHDTRSAIGGKGISVAIVLHRLQADVNCISCVGNADSQFFSQSMEREGARFQAILVPGSVRRNVKITDVSSHTVTELNEQGAEVNVAALAKFMDALTEQAENSRYIALSGSLPPGCGEDTYQTVMRRIPGKRWAVDSSGAALRFALREKPFLIKPNLAELEEIVGTKLTTINAIKAAAVKLCKAGVTYAAVSLGGQGALLTDGTKTVFAPAVPVTIQNTVGAGDSMLAGLLFGLERGETVFESLKYGMAAGAACVQGGSVHAFSKEVFTSLLPKVEMREI